MTVKKAAFGILIVCTILVTMVTVVMVSQIGHAMIQLINQMTSDMPAAQTPAKARPDTAKAVHKRMKLHTSLVAQ